MSHKITLVVVAIACLVVGGAAGYLARPLVRGANPTRTFAGGPGQRGQFRGGAGGGGRAFGTVASIGNGTMTITTPNGGSQIVLTNDSTTYQHVVAGSVSDIATGSQVMVNGQANPDGSTTANSIQVLPPGSQFPGRPTTSATPQ